MNIINLHQEQKKILKEIHKILKKRNFLNKCTIGFGTFLGAYRQQKLNTSINNWDDIDFEILYENFIDFKKTVLIDLINCNFKLVHAHLIKNKNEIGSLTLQKGNVRIDFQIIFNSKNANCFHFLWHAGIEMVKGLQESYYFDIKEYVLEDILFYGPSDAESYLIDMYGEDWKTPCRTEGEYKFWEDHPGKPWDIKYQHYNLIKGRDLKEKLNVR